MTDRELMQQALEALEWNLPVIEDYGDHEQLNRQHRAIIALRDRPAQPEQEPVAWVDDRIHGWPDCFVMQPDPPHTKPLYTSPPASKPWVGLTEQEPVAWITEWKGVHSSGKVLDFKKHRRGGEVTHWPLYTTPPQRKPLTDEECDNLWAAQLFDITDRFSARDFIRDVEAAHGIKGEA